MGLFSKDKKVVPYEVVKPNLRPQDGKLHVLMVDTWSQWSNLNFRCDEEYINEVDTVLVQMQDEGYEIVSIQHNSLSNGSGVGFLTYTTLITYR